MYNTLEDLKRLVGVTGDVLDLDDTVTLSSGLTAWGLWLTAAATDAEKDLQGWALEAGMALDPVPACVQIAESLLIKARIVQEFGFQDALDPEELSVGGSTGQRLKVKKLSIYDRGEVVSALRERARQMIARFSVSEFGGLL